MHVLVIGAGFTGLAIAQGLRKHGITCTGFERSSSNEAIRDWSMRLDCEREKQLLETLPKDISDRWKNECEINFGDDLCQQSFPDRDTKTSGVRFQELSLSRKRVSRARILKVLETGIDIRHDKKLIDIITSKRGVRVLFEDGSGASGDVLVGADGADSFVRSWLFDHAESAKAKPLPVIAYHFSALFPAELALMLREQCGRNQHYALHPDRSSCMSITILDAPENVPPERWIFQMILTHWGDTEKMPETSAERLQHFKDLGQTFVEPFSTASQAILVETDIPRDRWKRWEEPTPWDSRRGRVTLAGEAAHPFPPHQEKALNHAVEDVVRCVAAISTGNLGSKAFKKTSYEREVCQRGSHEVAMSIWHRYDAAHFDQ
ncbi:hypothetical protein CBER1_09039 [Cercospora berteroae]|uniref:FAD-binding domain-containing protein n=1 Tax=Cercospora berteroae TaxID=357750 RepID=A0A2S6CIZ5_9PEZI|nr:hypothetical protein CBER1_09039 [Cercospora berteroae]